MKTAAIPLTVAAIFITPLVSHAEMGPSFELAHSAWHASDIFIASEGAVYDGTVTVTAVWDGDLSAGETVFVPGLAEFTSEENRKFHTAWGERSKRPKIVSPQKLILFLRHEPIRLPGRDDTEETDEEDGVEWYTTSWFGSMQDSFAWLENNEVYAFTQTHNPGPSLLKSLWYNEKEMKERVDSILEVRKKLEAVGRIPNPETRAKKAAELLTLPAIIDPQTSHDFQPTNFYNSQRTFDILTGCGEAALPVLREILADDSQAQVHRNAAKALAEVGGETVVAELIETVRRELAFWKETAPNLQIGWWNGVGFSLEQAQPLRGKYGGVLEALRALVKMKAPECRDVVTEFRDFWRSLPQLEDKTGLNQMSQTCDRILQALPEG